MKKLIFAIILTLFALACSDNTAQPPSPGGDAGQDVAITEDVSASDIAQPDVSEPDVPGSDVAELDARDADETTDTSDQDTSDQDTSVEDTSDTVDVAADVAEDTLDTTPDVGNGDSPDLSCSEHGDCGFCAFPTAPTTVEDCYCVICPTVIMTQDACDANRDAWQAVCGDTGWEPDFGPCPIPRCVVPPPAACISGTCIDACERADCPDLPCPLVEQFIPPGECCPRCVGANTCQGDGDCTLCSHRTAPTAAEECVCPLCPVDATTTTTCGERSQAYNNVCDQDFQLSCPVAICLPQPAPVCASTGYCEEQPYTCEQADDCTRCPFSRAPTDPSECECAGCGTAMPADQCQFIQERVAEVCNGFAFDACLPTPCARPPEVTCDFGTKACVDVL